MMTVADDSLVGCEIDDSDDEQINIPPPPPEFASRDSTPAFKPPTPSPATPPTPTCPVNRDPNGISKHLKVDVGEVLSESTGPYSADGAWMCSAAVFEKTRIWTYRCLSLLLAVPLSFLYGISLALLASLRVWFLVPCVHLSNTFLPCLRSLCLCAVDVFVSPFCICIALCCSQITVSLSNKSWNQKTEKETV
ncbi:caveolin-2-like [Cololabis saira]|uniref:caveolin-2-like n=1 Tax=Cololabis saira TaxID=129043 RepID=UPI002AD41740|nr:caveolin-2-like [Cololabis saira]